MTFAFNLRLNITLHTYFMFSVYSLIIDEFLFNLYFTNIMTGKTAFVNKNIPGKKKQPDILKESVLAVHQTKIEEKTAVPTPINAYVSTHAKTSKAKCVSGKKGAKKKHLSTYVKISKLAEKKQSHIPDYLEASKKESVVKKTSNDYIQFGDYESVPAKERHDYMDATQAKSKIMKKSPVTFEKTQIAATHKAPAPAVSKSEKTSTKTPSGKTPSTQTPSAPSTPMESAGSPPRLSATKAKADSRSTKSKTPPGKRTILKQVTDSRYVEKTRTKRACIAAAVVIVVAVVMIGGTIFIVWYFVKR